jgi:site-specific DNA recombinase
MMEDAQGHEVASTLLIGYGRSMTTAREYLRVSADKGGAMRSPGEQHADNERVAAAERWTLGEPYAEEKAISASRYSHKGRPGFGALVADLERGTFGADVLILWEPSRGSRRLSEWARFLELLEERGVRLHVTSHGHTYNLANARDRRSLHEDGTDSEYESAKISMRATRTVLSRAAEGKPHGRCPWGYVRQYELSPSGKRMLVGQVRDPATAPIVARIYEAIGKKQTLRAIAAGLNADGIPAPKGGKWSGLSVRDLALNPAYGGMRLHVAGRRSGHDRTRHGTLVAGTWPGIVSVENWHATRNLLTDPKRRTSRPGRDKHLLSMIAVCAVCESVLTVRYKNREGQYSCRDGGHVRVRQDDLDGLMTRLAVERLARADEYPNVARRDVTADVQAIRDELASARAHHIALIDLMKVRKLSPLAFSEAEPAALADVDQAERRLRELETPDELRTLVGDPGEDIAAKWETLTMAARRDVMRLLFERVAVSPNPTPGHRAGVTERASVEWRQP